MASVACERVVSGEQVAVARVSERTTRVVRTEVVSIVDGPAQPRSYTQQVIRVARVEISFTLTDDGWEPAPPLLSGPVLKKDGTDSRSWGDQKMYGHEPWPDWLTHLIAELAAPQ